MQKVKDEEKKLPIAGAINVKSKRIIKDKYLFLVIKIIFN